MTRTNFQPILILRIMSSFVTFLLLVGCAHRPVKSAIVVIPRNCILNTRADLAKCKSINAKQMECSGVIVDVACVKVETK